MLTFEQIKEHFPDNVAQRNPKAMLVEYLQHEFLDSLFKQPGSEMLSFIGGTAIRIVFNSRRFSEDLDFDNFGLGYEDFKRLVLKSCREMEIKGFKLECRLLKKDQAYHGYIKFPLVLKQYGLAGHHLEKIFISLDAQRKKKIAAPKVFALNKFGVFRNIVVNPAPILLSQKLLAILFRRREQGRDFYDASFLTGLASPDFGYIKAARGLEQETFRKKFLKRCQGFDYPALARDVAAFLFDPEEKERVLQFYESIALKV